MVDGSEKKKTQINNNGEKLQVALWTIFTITVDKNVDLEGVIWLSFICLILLLSIKFGAIFVQVSNKELCG